ncbi:MAG: hypothetical protein L3J51_08445 [Cocleimonas sp.]|nr:hypothetical protein [Cocleimonas sp.]
MRLKVKTIIKHGYRFMALTFALVIFSHSLYAKEAAKIINDSQFSEPQFGAAINKAFTVIPNYMPDKKCISIENNDTVFYISKPLLEQLQLTQTKNDASNLNGPLQPEKHAAIRYAQNAKIILENQLTRKDKFGCSEIKATLSSKTLYLIKRLLNSGQVAVLDKAKNKFSKKIIVKYTAKQNTLSRIAYMTATIPSKSVLLLRWEDYL